MITQLTGIPRRIGDQECVIDVHGVGYGVHAPSTTLDTIDAGEGPVTLLIQTRMSDSEITLYGFATPGDLQTFRKLVGVQGVGPATALNLLSQITPGDLWLAIREADQKVLTAVKGIGPAAAKRLISELEAHAATMVVEMPAPVARRDLGVSVEEVSQSLQRLGHSPATAKAAAQFAFNGAEPGISEQTLIARALKAAAGMTATAGVAA